MKNSIKSVGDHAAAPAVVMVVEDEYFIRAMIADELRKSGFEVVECSSADEAMDVLNAGANPSVIFSDIRMPGSMDGVKLAQIVSEHFPDVLFSPPVTRHVTALWLSNLLRNPTPSTRSFSALMHSWERPLRPIVEIDGTETATWAAGNSSSGRA